MKGKDKCKILKEIRAQIAAANDIAWVTEECPHKGECRGTCPKCEAEVATLERALARRRALGKTVAVVGLSAGLMATTTACDALNDFGNQPLNDGDMAIPPAVSTTSDRNVAIAGVPMPPETTYVLDGDIVVDGGEPLPMYYLTDFTVYDSLRLFQAVQDVYLYEVMEETEEGDEVSCIPAGEDFTVLGDNGSEQSEAYVFLIRYKGKLYAIDKYDLDNATEYIAVDDGAPQ